MLADRKNHIRVISMITALSLLVMFIAPMLLVSPGISLTKNSYSPVKLGNTIARDYDGNILISTQINNSYKQNGISTGANVVNDKIYSPASVPLKTLLFGDGLNDLINDDDTLEQALDKAANSYFLGLASEFCAFIKGDFTVYDADAEGRVAVGGNLRFEGGWNYQIGSGDFASLTPLTQTYDYDSTSGFAHIICGGKLFRINTVSTGNYNEQENVANDKGWHRNGNTVVYDPEDDMYKKLLVSPDVLDGSLRYGGEKEGDISYSDQVVVEMPGTESGCDHEYLNNVNQLAQMYQYEYIRELIDTVYNKVDQRSEALAIMDSIPGRIADDGETVTFDGENLNATTIYFSLPAWDNRIKKVIFENIPDDTSIVVNVGGENFRIFPGDKGTVQTIFRNNGNDKVISNNQSNNSQEANDSNNNAASSRILYNFYEATYGRISGNFNGTILASKADVTAPQECPGHLSGALIAKSFEGGLEFGYRPYRGSADIIGLRTGYVIPVEKYVEGSKNRLADARFVLERVTDDNKTVPVYRWASDGKDPSYVPIPLQVNYTKTYTATEESNTSETTNENPDSSATEDEDSEPKVNEPEEISKSSESTNENPETSATEDEDSESKVNEPEEKSETSESTNENPETPATEDEVSDPQATEPQLIYPTLTARYILREENPPELYLGTSKYYQIDVTEKINQLDQGGRPNNVEYTVAISSPDSDPSDAETINFTVSDTGEAPIVRTITDGDKTYRITINNSGTNPVVTSVEKGDGTDFQSIQMDDTGKAQKIDDNFYYDPNMMMVMPLISETKTPSFENIPALLFEKVDDDGNPRTGATIRLTRTGTDPAIPDEANWKWPDGSSSCTINVKELPSGTYKLEETQAPQGYEKAEPIVFTWDEESGKLTYNGIDYTLPAKLRMIDNKIYGMKLELYKYDGRPTHSETDALGGAVFSLYAADDTLIKDGFETDATGKVDLNLSDVINARYVRNGYLLPGTYYLKETTLPTATEGQPFTQPDNIYFTVKKNNNGTFFVEALNMSKTKDCSYSVHSNWEEAWYGVHQLYINDDRLNGSMKETTSGGVIENVVSITLETNSTIQQAYADVASSNSVNSDQWSVTFDPPQTIRQCKFFVAYKDDFKYTLTIRTKDNITYISTNIEENIPEPSADEEETGLMTVDTQNSQQLKIANKSEPVNITAKKVWANDAGFEFLRNNVKLTLYRSPDDLTPAQQAAYAEGTTPEGVTIEQWQNSWNTEEDSTQTGTAVLSDENGWSYTWNKLEAFKQNSDGTYQKLYYYVKETPIGEVDYVTTYVRDGNQLTVTNTMNKIDLNVEKIWNNNNSSNLQTPSSIKVGLEVKHNENWEKVLGKTLTLYSANEWKGEFSNLPAGESFRIYEISVPTGWKVGPSNTVNTANLTADQLEEKTLTITNEPDFASLKLKKEWENEESVNELEFKLYRKEVSISGGYHDAGDHVMFGLPQGYTASMLGWSFNEFKDSYTDLGQEEHYKIIAKRFADFFYNAVKTDANGNITEILVQKGDGQTDHDYWGAPEDQGERTDQLFWRDTGGDIAAEYAATLAQYKVNFPEDPMADQYLEQAKKLYEFAKAKPPLNEYGVNRKEGTEYDFYKSDAKEDDVAWAAAWLYKATQEDQYKNELASYPGPNPNDDNWSSLNWNRVDLAASIMNGEINNNWNTASDWFNNHCKSDNYFFVGEWGSARYNCAAQLAALVASKHDAVDKEAWAQNQMGYILGEKGVGTANPKCFVTGFDENSPKNPHHRAASGTDSAQTNADSIENKHILLGALVGGPADENGAYQDIRSDYQSNEVSLDYNAGLVGAAAGLYYFYPQGITDADISASVPDSGVEITYGGGMGNSAVVNNSQNYAKLLQYSLYFYDANMCGSDVGESSALTWRKDCHVQDAQLNSAPAESETILPKLNTVIGKYWSFVNLLSEENAEADTVPAATRTKTRVLRLSKAVDLAEQLEVQAAKNSIPNLKGTNPNGEADGYPIEGILLSDTAVDIGNGGQQSVGYNPNIDNVDMIVLVFDKTPTGDGMNFTANNWDLKTGKNKGGSWSNYSGIQYDKYLIWILDESKTIREVGIQDVKISNGAKIQRVLLYQEVPPVITTFNVTPSAGTAYTNQPYTVTVSGQSGVITWEDNGNPISPNVSDNEFTFTFNTKGEHHIVGRDGNDKTGEFTVNVSDFSLDVADDATISFKKGGSKTVHINTSLDLNEFDIQSNPADSVVIRRDGNTITISSNTVTDTPVTVTVVSPNNEEHSFTVYVYDNITIKPQQGTETHSLYLDEILRLGLYQGNTMVNNVTWQSNNDVATVDQNGIVTAKHFGTATITATLNGETVSYIVNVKSIPYGAESVGNYTLKETDGWEMEVDNLPKVSPRGLPYIYYVEETESNQYAAISYSDGVMLGNGETPELTVNNKAIKTLPITGGRGTEKIYMAGGVMMLLAAAAYAMFKRREFGKEE